MYLMFFSGQRQKTNSFFNVPGLFIGLSPQVISDCDSVRSPTSPLDFKLFSNLGNSLIRFPKPSHDGGPQKSWDSNKVGLGSIVDDSLHDGSNNFVNLHEKKSVPCSSSKTILFGSQIRSKAPNSPTYNALFCEAPKSLPKNYGVFSPEAKMRPSNVRKGSSDVFFEIGDETLEFDPFEKIQSFSLDSKRVGLEMLKVRASNVTDLKTKQSSLECETSLALSLGGASYNTENKLTSSPLSTPSGNAFAPALTPSEIELSEDYTCVISHGPNPKATHIFGDCVLGCHPIGIDCGNKKEISEIGLPFFEKSMEVSPRSPYPSDDFLSFCCFCKKKLEAGTDIYMYRGEKAFCSSECRSEGISIEEEKEKSISEAPKEACESENGDDIFEKSIFVAI